MESHLLHKSQDDIYVTEMLMHLQETVRASAGENQYISYKFGILLSIWVVLRNVQGLCNDQGLTFFIMSNVLKNKIRWDVKCTFMFWIKE